MFDLDIATLIGVITAVLYVLAALAVIDVIQRARTPQSALAWSIALIALPAVTLPVYVVFGRNKFHGYVQAHRSVFARTTPQARELARALAVHTVAPGALLSPLFTAVEKLTGLPFANGNRVDLLIDADDTYGAIFDAIRQAESYVLVQYYIVRDDRTGRRFRDALVERAAAGVAVYFLYDEIGCVRLPRRYLRELEAAGITVSGFKTTRGPGNRWQINFRNHRKIAVVDGRVGFVGGLNIGDEYLGLHPRLGPWRDTHLRIAGPTVQMAQLAFVEDWYWANRRIPGGLRWTPVKVPGDGVVATIARTGPADEYSVCSLLHVEAFNIARRRLWVAVGFFVPDESIVRALQLAALRGVDVRLLLTGRSDIRTAWLASFTYLDGLTQAGVKVLHYRHGVMHQKVFLVDDELASVGSTNLDNRSLYINFELSALVVDRGFAKAVERMLEADFARAVPFEPGAFARKPRWFQLSARAASLASPML